MLKGINPLMTPELLTALARMGHGDTIAVHTQETRPYGCDLLTKGVADLRPRARILTARSRSPATIHPVTTHPTEAKELNMGRVIVVGSINQDITVTVDRLPQPGETLSGTSTTYRLGGKGANQAAAAAHGGAAAVFVGRVGGDPSGITLREELGAHGVDVSALRTDEEVTSGIAFITVSTAGENTIILDAGANGRVTGRQAVDAVVLTEHDVVVLQGEIPSSANEEVISWAHGAGARVVLNLAPVRPVSPRALADVDVLVVNETECGLVLDAPPPGTAAAAAAAAAVPGGGASRTSPHSVSLTTRTSTSARARGETGRTGARLRTTLAPAPCAQEMTSSLALEGISPWRTTTSCSVRTTASTACRPVTRPLAPASRMIVFSPAVLTVMKAIPLVTSSSVRRAETSTPCAPSSSRSVIPEGSPPTRPTNTAAAPPWAAAAAWFAPLPPRR